MKNQNKKRRPHQNKKATVRIVELPKDFEESPADTHGYSKFV